MKRYTAKELRGMKLRELDQAGAELGLSFNKNVNRAERARRILAAYSEQDLAGDSSHATDPPSLDGLSDSVGSPKPDFEALITSETDEAEVTTQTPQRGGARPGAGRPEGMTNEIAAFNRLSVQPNPAVKQALEMIFESWSVAAKCPEIRLTRDEAFDLALPWTNALELMGVAQRIPPWLMVAVSCVWSTANIVKCKAALARHAAANRKRAEESVN